MQLTSRITPELRANPEFQSAVVRIAIWSFGLAYIGIAAQFNALDIDYPAFLSLFSGYLILYVAILVSVLVRPTWDARRFAALFFDTIAVSLAIYLTGDPGSPFYLVYIWIFISASTRYGRRHLVFAAAAAVVFYNVTLAALGAWSHSPMDAVFRLLVLVLLPLYQDSLLLKLRAAQAAAEQASKAKSTFLANMTHELRTPLMGVLGMTHLLETTEPTKQQREYLDAIRNAANVLQTLIGDVLDLSKIDAGKLKLERDEFDIRRPILEVCRALRPHAQAQNLELVCDVAPTVPAVVVGDVFKVQQILFNLVGNAFKFTDHGQVLVRASRAEPEAEAEQAAILIEVVDTGIGIAPDKLESIFESFSQADDSTTRRYGGTGLGTTIARNLCELMGGSIHVESTLGQGTCFRVRLPLATSADASVPLPDRDDLKGKKVLIYEGNAAQREILEATCQALGMQCFAENDVGRLASVLQGIGHIDLVIIGEGATPLDITGLLDTFERLLSPRTAYLLLAYAQRRAELSRDGHACLTRPFLREQLIDAIASVLGCSVATEPDRAASSNQVAEAAASRNARVLVAEDNKFAATVLRTMLTRYGASVTLATDGEQALAAAGRENFDLAFIDLRMPKIDGVDFTRRVRESEQEGAHLPIIALTANAQQDIREHCLDAGMDDFLSKPVDPEALRAAVVRYASNKGD